MEKLSEYKAWIISGLVFIGSLFLVVVLWKKRQADFVEGHKNNFTEQDAKNALQVVKNNYGVDMAKQIEKLARLETAHFKSTQFQRTGTGGMEVPKGGLPPYYGWGSTFFLKHPFYTPVGTTDMFEGKGTSGAGGNKQVTDKPKVFVVMPSVEAWMMFLAWYAGEEKDKGGLLHWYSTDPAKQKIYAESLSHISTPITNSLA